MDDAASKNDRQSVSLLYSLPIKRTTIDGTAVLVCNKHQHLSFGSFHSRSTQESTKFKLTPQILIGFDEVEPLTEVSYMPNFRPLV
jgi:hypothetical protein